MTHVYTLANAKGGCGKSTVALNLAVCFARAGHRTLAVDLDQQGNLSAALGVDLNQLKLTAHRLLINDEAEIGSFLLEPRLRLKLLPNTIDVEADDLLEAKKVNRELLLRRKLRPVLRDFDIVVIDTPPAMRSATLNGLAVADTVIIPVDGSSYFALLGLNQLLQVVAAIRDAHKPDMVIRALTTMYNRRQNLDKQIRRQVEAVLWTGVGPRNTHPQERRHCRSGCASQGCRRILPCCFRNLRLHQTDSGTATGDRE